MFFASRFAPGLRRVASARGSLRVLALVGSLALGSSSIATTASADIVIVPAAADSAPYSFLPSLARFNNPTLYAFEAFAATSSAHDFETYLAFDVEQGDLPAGHVLVEATLLVTYSFDFTGFGEPSIAPGEIACREVLEPWNQTTLTWLNRPDVDEPFDVVGGITGFGAVLCDATPVVLAWLTQQAPNHGFALTNATERVIGMHSLESSADPSLMPQLILRTEIPEPASGIALAVGGAGLASLTRRRRRHARRAAGSVDSGHVGA